MERRDRNPFSLPFPCVFGEPPGSAERCGGSRGARQRRHRRRSSARAHTSCAGLCQPGKHPRSDPSFHLFIPRSRRGFPSWRRYAEPGRAGPGSAPGRARFSARPGETRGKKKRKRNPSWCGRKKRLRGRMGRKAPGKAAGSLRDTGEEGGGELSSGTRVEQASFIFSVALA